MKLIIFYMNDTIEYYVTKTVDTLNQNMFFTAESFLFYRSIKVKFIRNK